MRCDLESRQQALASNRLGKLLQIEFGSFLKISDGLLDRLPVRSGPSLWIKSYKSTFGRRRQNR